jgi:hypothetical protein
MAELVSEIDRKFQFCPIDDRVMLRDTAGHTVVWRCTGRGCGTTTPGQAAHTRISGLAASSLQGVEQSLPLLLALSDDPAGVAVARPCAATLPDGQLCGMPYQSVIHVGVDAVPAYVCGGCRAITTVHT